jgi:3-phenylpropionate/trans-cinnamate dioxygenase ferredoxin subunit
VTTVDLGPLGDFPDGEARRIEVDGLPALAVVRLDDDVYALGDRCTHQDISLSEGDVDGDERTLECWKHGSAFDLRTGEPTSLPAVKPTPVYDVAVVDGRVVLTLAAEPAEAAG